MTSVGKEISNSIKKNYGTLIEVRSARISLHR